MICKNCGIEVAEGFTFCTNCGAQLSEPESAPEVVEAVETPVADQQNVVDPGKTLGTISLILSIAGLVMSLVTFCCGYASLIASPLCIVGLILAIVGKKKSAAAGCNNGAANIGLILSIIGLVAGVVIGIVAGVLGAIGMTASEMANMPMYG